MKFLILVLAFLFTFSALSMERTVATKQRGIRMLNVKVSSAGVDSGLDSLQVATSKSATGTYGVVFNEPYNHDVQAIVVPVATACAVKTITESITGVTVVMAAADHATDKDCAFNLFVVGSDSPDKF